MGQPWNILGSEGGRAEASGSESEGEAGAGGPEEPVVPAAGHSWARRALSPLRGGGSWSQDIREARVLVKLAASV